MLSQVYMKKLFGYSRMDNVTDVSFDSRLPSSQIDCFLHNILSTEVVPHDRSDAGRWDDVSQPRTVLTSAAFDVDDASS